MSRFVNKLTNQTVLVMGGTGGVGMSIAAGVLEFGGNVIISGPRQEKLDAKLAQLREQYPDLKPPAVAGFTCDLASRTQASANITALADKVKSHLANELGEGAQLNHFVYAAGDGLSITPLDEVTQDKFHTALQVRATSCLLAVKVFAPLLPKSNRSSITLTSGSIAEKPLPGGWAMVSFLGGGLVALARQLAADLAPVRVNSVCPGIVATDLWRDMSDDQRRDYYAERARDLPTGDVGRPDDVAEVYFYLMKDANITGSVIHTNGGAML